MTKTLSLLVIAVIFILTGCTSQRKTTIVGSEYDESKNETSYFVSPIGSVLIPGKWEKQQYNTISGQQFFKNADSIGIAIAFNKSKNYEFNSDGSKKGYDFAKAFYEWDSEYFVNTYGLNREVLEKDSTDNFILYQLYGTIKGSSFDTYFLIGEKNGTASNFSISITDKWTADEKIKFLKGLYIKN